MTDPNCFEAVYREDRPKVLDYINSHVSEPQDAEDLCSEVFRKALEHLAPDKPGVSSYIYTITRNTVIDFYRTQRVHSPLSEELKAIDGPEAEILGAERLENLADALRRIPERERDIVILHYYAHDSLREVSEKMSLPYGVVKRAHRSALRHLRKLLE